MTYIRLIAFTLLLSFTSISFAQQDNIQLLRNPALNTDGWKVAFSYQGDIWLADLRSEMPALRLTVHEAYESNPRWSQDGSQIAFTSNRHGNDDIFVLDINSDEAPRRITYHSTNDRSPEWGPGNTLYFTSRRTFTQLERDFEILSVDANGGTPTRFLDATGDMPAVSPDGKFIAFTRGTCRITREAYRGPANRNIWIYNVQSRQFSQLTTSSAMEIYPRWGEDSESLFYLSAENGRYNIYKLSLDENASPTEVPIAISEFSDEGIRNYDVSANGKKVVFEYGEGLWTQNARPFAKASKLNLKLSKDFKFYPEEQKSLSKGATEYKLSPNENYIALVIRGEVFITQNDKEKKRSVRITDHPYRDRNINWLNDSTLLFISDRSGNNDLYMARSTDSENQDLFRTFKKEVIPIIESPEDEEAYYISPDQKQIAVRRGRGQLFVADISPEGVLSNEKTLINGWDIPEGIAWSPDSRWLAYALEDLDFNEEIYIHRADNSQQAVNVSLHPRGDYSPVWSDDGKKLGFRSIRNNGDADIWFVWLKKADWEKTKSDWEDEPEDKSDDRKEKKDKEKKEIPEVKIDFEDIHERLEQVTRLPGNEGNLVISNDGETFFFTTNGGGRAGSPGKPNLMSVKWDGEDLKTLKEDFQVRQVHLDDDGKHLYAIKNGGTLTKFNLADKKSESLPFAAKMTVDHKRERQQIFDEAWRSLKDGFYDPEFHGKDWTQLRAQYEPRALAASTAQDFRDMFNAMLGQLNASHMGMSGNNPEDLQNDKTGYLGIEGMPSAEGFRIQRIIPNTPADKSESKLNIGDIITHVNGDAVVEVSNFYQLLNLTVDERILLQVKNASGQSGEVIVRPVGSLRTALYNAWVKERKRLTEEYSQGRLGYIHIQGMNWPSFERFERELAASGLGKEGLVIDVRFNGGGWTTDMLMAVLNVRQHAYTIPRGAAGSLGSEHMRFREHYPYGERLPFSSWTKPSVALCNENSYSNAEIFSHAFKTLDIGTLVGMPTFGAVISTGGRSLIDGSRVRMPFRAWYVKATDQNMEHGPAVPDVMISNAPNSKAKGEDPQLMTAVQILLKEIEEKKEAPSGSQ